MDRNYELPLRFVGAGTIRESATQMLLLRLLRNRGYLTHFLFYE
jgi:hypothetical protein